MSDQLRNRFAIPHEGFAFNRLSRQSARKQAFSGRPSDPADAQGNQLLVPIHPGDTPVPIPNTTVKTRTAEGTMLETAWENRWVPEFMTGFYRSPEGSGG